MAGKDHDPNSTQFGRLPYAVLTPPDVLAGLTESQLKVYVALALHANECWEAFPSTERLGEMTGYTTRSIRRTLSRLIEIGLIQVVGSRLGGKGKTTRYRLATNPDSQASAYPAAKPGQPEGQTRTQNASNPDANSVRRTEKQKKNRSSTAAADDSVQPTADEDVLVALKQAGIGEPTRTRFAQLPGVTVAIVQAAQAHCHERGKPVGILIREIEARVEQANLPQPPDSLPPGGGTADGLLQCGAIDEDDPRLDELLADLCPQGPQETTTAAQALRRLENHTPCPSRHPESPTPSKPNAKIEPHYSPPSKKREPTPAAPSTSAAPSTTTSTHPPASTPTAKVSGDSNATAADSAETSSTFRQSTWADRFRRSFQKHGETCHR